MVAFEFPPYRGGIANYSHSLAKHLTSNGNRVKVFTLNHQAPDGKYALCKPSWGYRPEQWSYPVRKLLSFIYRQYQFYFYRGLRKRLLRHYQEDGSQIIITSLFFDFSRKLITDLTDQGVSYSLVLHGLDLYEIPNRYPDFFDRAIINAQNIIFNSEYTKGLFEQMYSHDVEKKVVPPLLDVQAISQIKLIEKGVVEDRLNIRKNSRWVFTVCRLVFRKGVDRSIKALIEIMREKEDIVYLIAGKGDEEDALRALVPDHLTNRVLFLGSISEQLKFSLLFHSEIVMMPNRGSGNDVEGFGISFIEASFMKNWVIGGDSGGVPEAVRIDLNGYLMGNGGTIEELVGMLKDALSRSDIDQLAKARQWVMDQFDIKRKLML